LSLQDTIDSKQSEKSPSRAFLTRSVELGLQPALLVASLGLWLVYPDKPAIYLVVLVGGQILLGTLEHVIPQRPDWVQPTRELSRNIAIAVVILAWSIVLAHFYQSTFSEPLAALRSSLHLDFWPTTWPLFVQVFLAFVVAEFFQYWIHRAEHRWGLVWRFSGHGAHHSFKHLGAINSGVDHPFELFLLVAPAALTELLFGAGIAAAGAAIITVTQTSIAHSNLRLNTKWIGGFLTTNEYHIRHHSIVFAESNTNYSCSAIIWDRIFGTFAAGPTLEAGIGPSEPSLWEKIMMPIREPSDSEITPGVSHAESLAKSPVRY